MKTLSRIVILFIALNLWAMIIPQKATAQVSISFQAFYDNLSPYGNWTISASYGYVWIPDVSPNFSPYATNGHWVYTNLGWTWVSHYPWGWAPFHYGRWYYDYPYGWIWVPDYEWAPAWVVWRRSEGFYGWAPIGPGISISFAYSSGYNLPYNQWRFVRNNYFGRTNINNYYINTSENRRVLESSTVINNITVDNSSRVRYAVGPNRNEVQKRTGNTFAPIAIRESNKPGQRVSKNELQIYRPRVEKNTVSGRKPAPSKVVSMKDVKPRAQSNTETRAAQQPQSQKQSHGQPPQKQQQQKQYDQPAQQPQKQKQNQGQPAQKQQKQYDQPIQQPQKQNQGQPDKKQFPNYEKPQHRDQPVQQPQKQNQGQPDKQQFPNYEKPQHRDQPIQQPQKQNQGQPDKRQFPNYEKPQHRDQPVQQPQKQNQGQPAQQQSQKTHPQKEH
jgi:hypothetical protein